MSLSARLKNAVNKAFNAAGDLVKIGTLSNKTVSGYDFATRQTVGKTKSITVEVIITDTKKRSGEGFTTTGIMKSGVNLSVYDTLTVDGKAYKIVDYNDNGFSIDLILSKEV